MRTVVIQRYVYLGTVTDDQLAARLEARTQQENDALLASAIGRLGLDGVTGRLGSRRFTLVGDDRLGRALSEMEGDELEEQLCTTVGEEIGDATTGD